MRHGRAIFGPARSSVEAERAVEESVQRAARAGVLVDALLGREADGAGRIEESTAGRVGAGRRQHRAWRGTSADGIGGGRAVRAAAVAARGSWAIA